jgi:nicotinate-nucleotide adenylyltransferase
MAQDELIFFGGSFNPWHEGHSSCINLMDDSKTIIVIPDHNPFKELVKSGEKESSLQDIRSKLNEFKNPTYIFTEFFELNEKNPTHLWVSKIRAKFPSKKISLLMGFDTFMGIDKWINAESLLGHLSCLYVASRLDNEELKNKQIQLISSLSPVHIHFLGRHDYEDLSSTELRKL